MRLAPRGERFRQTPFFAASSPIRHRIDAVANPVLASDSANIVTQLFTTGGNPKINVVEFGCPLYFATANTPRWSNFKVTNATEFGGGWGASPFGGFTIPIEEGWQAAPGSDAWMCVVDTDQNVFGLWKFQRVAGTPQCDWGGRRVADPSQNTIGDAAGAGNGAGINRLAGLITRGELMAGEIPHALVFVTPYARPTTYQFPAIKTDGSNTGGGTFTIREGTRIQLNPAYDLDAVAGITALEKMIGRAMQRYGAYCIDNGGGATGVVFVAETSPSRILDVATWRPNDAIYGALGVTADYPILGHIDWAGQMRVLNFWDGN